VPRAPGQLALLHHPVLQRAELGPGQQLPDLLVALGGEALGERRGGALGIGRDPRPPRRALRPPRAGLEVERHATGGVPQSRHVEEGAHRPGELARRLARVGPRDGLERGHGEGGGERDHAEDDEQLDEREAPGLWADAAQVAPSS
jgi:hypothetical protein